MFAIDEWQKWLNPCALEQVAYSVLCSDVFRILGIRDQHICYDGFSEYGSHLSWSTW